MDKFGSVSIYDYDLVIEGNDGEQFTFTFKPLPFKYYSKAYGLMSKLLDSGLLDNEEDMTDEEKAKKFMKSLNEDLMNELVFLEKEMVIKSYPDKSEGDVEIFVMSNAFELLEPLLSLINRQNKSSPRKAQAVQNELSRKN